MSDLAYKVAEVLYEKWCDQRIERGFHNPLKCPDAELSYDEEAKKDADILHCNHCDPHIGDFEALGNFKKDEYLTQAENLIKSLEAKGIKLIEK